MKFRSVVRKVKGQQEIQYLLSYEEYNFVIRLNKATRYWDTYFWIKGEKKFKWDCDVQSLKVAKANVTRHLKVDRKLV